MGKKNMKGKGALPPPGTEWQIGRSAGTIQFVKEAEKVLAAGLLKDKHVVRLQEKVNALRRGDHDLIEWLTVEEFLSRTSS